ncbi:DsrE family protein [Vibrio viridaestus]|nr:DsrE family protein [Vibrio viridaestus]
MMKSLKYVVAICMAIYGLVCSYSYAAVNADPLFINMTSDDSHRSEMAIGFGKNQLERGHPLIVFLNDKGVLVAAKQNNVEYTNQQRMLLDIIESGGVIYACPSCMKFYNVEKSELLDGVKVSNPNAIEAELFKTNTRTLSW